MAIRNKTKHCFFNAAIISSLENVIILFQRIMKNLDEQKFKPEFQILVNG